MSSSVQPLSTAAASSLIHELESVEIFLGASPIGATGTTPNITQNALAGKFLAKVLDRLRSRILPAMLSSLNRTEITVTRSTRTDVAGDPLGSSYIESTETVYAAIIGPSAESMENGFLQEGDFEAIIAANDLTAPLEKNSTVTIASVDYDVVAIRGYPQVPNPVAYRYWLKKVA